MEILFFMERKSIEDEVIKIVRSLSPSEPKKREVPFERLYVAVVTPFLDGRAYLNPQINYSVLDVLIERLITSGVKGVVVAGSTGSASVLSRNQHVGLVKYVEHNFGNRLEVISADGSNSTWEAIELAKRIESEAGVFKHLSVYGYYTRPSDEGIQKHFETLADNISGNLILYSIPSRASGITPEVIHNLSGHPGIIGVKNCPEDLEDTRRKIELTRDTDFYVFAGNDSDAVETIRAGGYGLISTVGNVCPLLTSNMVSSAVVGNINEARRYEEQLKPLISALFPKPVADNKYASPNPVMCHHALDLLGFGVGNTPIQLCEGSEFEKAKMRGALEKLNLLSRKTE